MGTEILIGLAISAATTVATSLLAPKQTLLPVDKGRFDDIRVQGSEYGTAIPIVYGRARLAGNIIYSDGVQPHVTTTPGRPGGKFGGGRPPEPPVNHYSYTTNIAVAICEGEIKGGLKRMWEDTKVTMGTDTNPLPDGTTIEAELTTNTHDGDVQIARDLAASGEYKVYLNGNNSAVTINNFQVPQLGVYNIKIIYMGLGSKTAEVFVDATSKGVITFPSTGSDNVSQTKVIQHTFAATGTHTIKIKRDGSNPAPYIDAVGIYGATATATANVSGGAVTSVNVTSGGGGYSVAPLVRFFGEGTGATATATISNGVVTAINVTNGGTGYTTPPTVDIMPSVTFTPTQVSGIINPELPYNSNPDYQYQYYNNSLIPDVNGTSSAGLGRIVDNPLPYPEDPTNTGGTGGGGTSTTTFGSFTFYSGSETQTVDPYLITLEGNNVPGYRGTSYIVLKNYQIPDGRMPNFTFEVEEGTHNLANILVSLWGRVGLDPAQLDVSTLDGVFVEGLVINTRTVLSDILDALCIAYAFDFVDLNGKVTAVKRGSTPVATIYESELKAYEDGGEVPVAALETTYVDVKELPKQIDVSYMDRARSYYQNVQPAIKQIGTNEEPQTLVLPLVMPAAQAKEIGNRVLNTIYLQKAQYNFTLPPKYSWLSPTDVVTLVMNNATHNLRIAQFQTGMPGLCKAQAVPDSASLYLDAEFESTIAGTELPPIPYPAVTQCTFMDIPPLLPEHMGFGFYAAACGSGVGNWSGAHLYREEIPNSNEWLRMGSFELPSILGTVGEALANTTGNTDIGGGRMIDTLSSITVNLYTGTLESYNNADLFDNPNLNLAYIGGEVVQFASASSVVSSSSPYVRRYTLTNFRRGLNGTTSKVGGHSAGEEFVLLDSSAQWMRIPSGHLFTDYRYKVVSVGVPLEGVPPIVFNTGTGSAPPVATNLNCVPEEIIAQDGTTQIVIRGTFSFGTFAGGQRAKVFVRRPTVVGGTTVEPTFFNTGITVSPDANNNGGFELPAVVAGRYIIQVVTMTPFDLSAPSGHPESTLDVVPDATAPNAPTWQSPSYVFDGQTVTWKWNQSTVPNHSHYKVYNGAGTVIAARVDGNTYTEYPTNGATRKVTAVNNSGIESAFSGIETFTLSPPDAPTGYNVVFNGTELLHSWVAPAGATAQYTYEIADGTPTVLGISGTPQWTEGSPPASRSFTRQVRTKLFGVTSSWTSTTVNIPTPLAPTSVAFNTGLATPFDVPVVIAPNASMNERQILRTKVEVMDSAGTTVLQTLYFSGVARTVSISGRFLSAPNNVIKVRATFVDFIGDGSSAITPDTYTFSALGGTDIGNNTIGTAHIQNGAIIGAHIGNGVLTTAHFASSIRPIDVISATSLPVLPSTTYTAGSVVYWIGATTPTDRKLWRTVDGATWTKAVDAVDLVANSITAGQIAAGAISATEIAAGAIRADKLAIGTIQDNLIPNSSFENFVPTPYSAGTSQPVGWAMVENASGTPDWSVSSDENTEGNYSLRLQGATAGFDIGSTVIPIIGGKKYIIRYRYKTAATSGTFGIHINYLSTTPLDSTTRYLVVSGLSGTGLQARDAAETGLTNFATGTPLFNQTLTSTGGNWVTREAVWTPAVGVKYATFVFRVANPNSAVYIDEVDVRREITGVIIEDGTLTANKLVAETITGDKIQAGTLTVDKFATRILSDNLILNSDFESYNTTTSKPYNWDFVNGTNVGAWESSATESASGGRSLRLLNTTASQMDIGSEAVPVIAGEKYYVSFFAKMPVSTAGTMTVYFLETNAALPSGKLFVGDDAANAKAVDYSSYRPFVNSATGANIEATTTNTILTTSWKRFEMEYTVPAGVKFATLSFRQLNGTNPIYFDSVVFRRYVPGVTIEDGTVTAPKIKAGSITAEKLAIGAFGDNLVTNPSFEDFDSVTLLPRGWVLVEGAGTFSSSSDFKADGNYALKLDSGSANIGVGSVAFPVTEGSSYVIRFKVRTTASTGTYFVRAQQYTSGLASGIRYVGGVTAGETVTRSSYTDLTNTYLGVSQSLSARALTTVANLGWVQHECIYNVPAGVKYISLSFYTASTPDAAFYVDDIVAHKKSSGVFIENGTITAENLVIGGMTDNLLANPSFQTPATTGDFAANWTWHVSNVATRQQHGTTGNYYAQMTSGGGITSRMIPVSPGQRIAVRFRAWAASNGNTMNVHPTFVQNRNVDKEYIGATNPIVQGFDGGDGSGYLGLREPRSTYSSGNVFTLPLTLTTTPTTYEGIIEVPANRYWMSFSTNVQTGTCYIEDIEIKRQVGQAFISDLRAEQIIANTVGAGLVFADQIKQANFTPYQTGSSYTPDLGYDFSYASGATYDLITNTITISTSTVNNNTNSVVTTAWQKINSGTNGFLEFIVPADIASTKSFIGGLTADWNPASYAANSSHFAVDYAWYYNGTTAYIVEADANQFTVGTLLAGDVLRVSIENDYVRFRKNGVLIWTSPYRPSAGTIRHGTRNSVTLNTQNANYRGVLIGAGDGTVRSVSFVAPRLVQEGSGQGWKLNPLTGTALFADEPHWDTNYDTGTISSSLQVGRMVQKSAAGASAWDTSLVTTQQILSGDGWFEVTIRDLATLGQSFFGLTSNSDWANPNYNPYVTYGIHFISSSSAQVWENGVYTGTAISVEQGNSFRVALEGGFVKYLKNNSVFYEHATTPSYPLRGKVWLYTPSTKLEELLFTASSSGLGEFNSGITVRGRRIEDIVKLSTTALRGDNRYRGNDLSIPSNVVSSINYDNYFISWEDGVCFISIAVNINDYKTNSFKNFDSVKHVRVRVYNRFGELIKQTESPYHGRGLAFTGFYKRAHADGKQEAVFSFEFENLYGYSAPIWYSEAGWLDGTADTWIEAPQSPNISYSAPLWYNKNDIPTNAVATTLTSTSIQLTWTKAVNGAAWNYQVYFRVFKPEGYEGHESYGGWTPFGSTTTDTFKTVTGLQANTRYELMVQGDGVPYGWSETVHARTYLIIPVTTGFGTPSGVSGSALSSSQIALSWVKNDTGGYIETEIWRTSAAAGTTPAIPDHTATQIGSGLTGTNYTNTGLTENTTYSYRLRNKYTGPAYSDWSATVTVTTPLSSPLTPPSGVTVTTLGNYSLRVTFYGNNGSTNYRVQAAYDGDYDFLYPVYDTATAGTNGVNSITINGLSSGTDYIIRVAKDGTSDWSLTAYGSTTSPGGGGYCILETEPITYVSPTNDIFEVSANTIKAGQMVLGTIAGRREVQPAIVKKVTPQVVNGLLEIVTKTGAKVKCSLAHKPITNWNDTTGVRAELLQEGDTVLVYDKMTNAPILDIIERIEYIAGEFTVIELSLDSEEHTYIGGGIFAHNSKPYDYNTY